MTIFVAIYESEVEGGPPLVKPPVFQPLVPYIRPEKIIRATNIVTYGVLITILANLPQSPSFGCLSTLTLTGQKSFFPKNVSSAGNRVRDASKVTATPIANDGPRPL